MKILRFVAEIAVISTALGLCGSPALAQNAPALKTAPDFTLTDSKGKSVKLSDFKGKIVVLEWTNPDCPFVQRHYKAGTMVILAKRYEPKGVAWLAINTTYYMDRAKDAQWAQKNQLPYPILGDHAGTVARLYSAKSSPHMFIIDAAGNLVYQGGIDNDPAGDKKEGRVNYVAQALDELLAGKPVSVPETKSYGCSMKFAPESK